MNTTSIAQSTYTNQDIARFTAKVIFPVNPDGCWTWAGAKHGQGRGYGKFRLGGKVVSAHRAAYRLFVGEVTPGNVVGHQCNNEACCNPFHVKDEPQSENCKYMLLCGRHNSQRH